MSDEAEDADARRWAEEMLAQLDQGKIRATERRQAFVAQCGAMAEALWTLSTSVWPTDPDTQRAADTKVAPVIIAGEPEAVADLVNFEVGVHLRSGADQLRGFASVIDAQSSFIGGVTLARGFFEACTWTAAIVDHRLSADQRAQRALTRRLARLSATVRIRAQEEQMWEQGRTAEPGEEDPASAIQSVLAHAADRGWRTGTGRFGPWIGTPLSVDGLIKEMSGDEQAISQYSWTTSSSVNHAEHSADVMTWLDLLVDIDMETTPGWLTVAHSPGILVGLMVVLEELGRYLGRALCQEQMRKFHEAWESASG